MVESVVEATITKMVVASAVEADEPIVEIATAVLLPAPEDGTLVEWCGRRRCGAGCGHCTLRCRGRGLRSPHPRPRSKSSAEIQQSLKWWLRPWPCSTRRPRERTIRPVLLAIGSQHCPTRGDWHGGVGASARRLRGTGHQKGHPDLPTRTVGGSRASRAGRLHPHQLPLPAPAQPVVARAWTARTTLSRWTACGK